MFVYVSEAENLLRQAEMIQSQVLAVFGQVFQGVEVIVNDECTEQGTTAEVICSSAWLSESDGAISGQLLAPRS